MCTMGPTPNLLDRRRFLARSAAAVAAIAFAPALLTACGSGNDDTLAKARRNGNISLGIAGEVPYGYYAPDGRPTGEGPEVARAVFGALGVPAVHAAQVPFGSLIDSLIAGRFDVVAAGMNITPSRCEQAAFSIPDYTAPVAFLVPKGNPRHLASFDDVKRANLRVAVLEGAVEHGFANDAGVPDTQISVLKSQDDLLAAVTSGSADCAALTNISLNSLVRQHPTDPVEVTKGFFPTKSGTKVVTAGGFVFRKQDTNLVREFDRVLKRLHDDGSWLRIVEPFGFTADNLPGSDVSTCRNQAVLLQ